MDTPGNLFCVAAPSGAGKSSLVKALLELDSRLAVSVSHTTRPPRGQEKHGREYYFVSDEEFDTMIQAGSFVEWAHVHGRRYGTSRKAKFDAIMTQVRENAKGYLAWFSLHQAIMNAKTLVVRKLGQASRVQTFVPTENGFRVTGPEGFVATSHTGQMVKLVDRLEFSRANFLAPKDWVPS